MKWADVIAEYDDVFDDTYYHCPKCNGAIGKPFKVINGRKTSLLEDYSCCLSCGEKVEK